MASIRTRLAVRAAFTLIEMMVVLALMVGIAAVVLPLSVHDAKRVALREAEAQLEAVMLSARADAQRMGRSVRVVAELVDDRWILREEEPAPQAEGVIGVPRLIQEIALPQGVRLARTREEAEGVVGGEGDGSMADEPGDSADADRGGGVGGGRGGEPGGAEMQVAMILPDGQITPTRPLYLRGPDGRAAEVVMNSWTGAVAVNVLAPREDDLEAPGDADGGPDTGEGGDGQEPR